MSNVIVSTHNLTKQYTTFHKESGFKNSFFSLFHRKKVFIDALKATTFDIHEGEIVGLLGPNGAGKTTLIKCLTGVMHPTDGTAEILGFVPWERKQALLKQITLVMGQKNQLWWDLPPVDTFALHKHIYEIPEKVYNDTLSELSELLEVSDIITTPTRKLSLGQRMKCELICALLHQPKVVFLDEPTIGLDVLSQKNIRDFLKAYNKRTHASILLTSHYMEDIKELCERVIIINHGQIMKDTSYKELIEKYTPTVAMELEFKEIPTETVLKSFGDIIRYDKKGRIALLSIPRKETTTITGKILNSFEVTNLSLHEKEASEVIREVFAAGKG